MMESRTARERAEKERWLGDQMETRKHMTAQGGVYNDCWGGFLDNTDQAR